MPRLSSSDRSPSSFASFSSSLVLSQPFSVKIPVGDRHTGHIGRQASGDVIIVYTTVCLSDVPSEPSDFFPLDVNYQECFSTAGRTSGGFFKREGRTKDHEILFCMRVLICRLIDRPLRPTILKGFYDETIFFMPLKTSLYMQVLSYVGLYSPDSLAITAVGIAVALSEVPNSKTIAGVQIGLVGDKFIVNPTTKEWKTLSWTYCIDDRGKTLGYCEFLSEEKLLQAVEVGQDAIRAICNEVDALVKNFGNPKMFDAVKLPPHDPYKHVEAIIGDELVQALQIKNKIPRQKAHSLLEEKVLTILTEKGYVSTDPTCGVTETIVDLVEDEDEDEEVVVDGEEDEDDVHIKPTLRKTSHLLFSEVDVKLVFKEVTSKYLWRCIVENGRSDGRTLEDIRPINSRCSLLPRVHGSALFTRDIFKPDPNFIENEKCYEELKKSILGDESEDENVFKNAMIGSGLLISWAVSTFFICFWCLIFAKIQGKIITSSITTTIYERSVCVETCRHPTSKRPTQSPPPPPLSSLRHPPPPLTHPTLLQKLEYKIAEMERGASSSASVNFTCANVGVRLDENENKEDVIDMDLLVRHNLDVMHIEKNVCESLIGTLLNIPGKTKDGENAKLDMVTMGIRESLKPILEEGKMIFLPVACYTLSRSEKRQFCSTLAGVKVPIGYSSNIKILVQMKNLKLIKLKSHDYHTLMQQLLPVAI
ncbi:hypothetical protein UlMin_013978 [Ulmus minor]